MAIWHPSVCISEQAFCKVRLYVTYLLCFKNMQKLYILSLNNLALPLGLGQEHHKWVNSLPYIPLMGSTESKEANLLTHQPNFSNSDLLTSNCAPFYRSQISINCWLQCHEYESPTFIKTPYKNLLHISHTLERGNKRHYTVAQGTKLHWQLEVSRSELLLEPFFSEPVLGPDIWQVSLLHHNLGSNQF